MPKARVFELAKEMGMQYEDLLDRLTSMGMEGVNRMSSLDEDEIRRIKAEIGPPKPKLYDERRVARTIIRRRKKESPEPEVQPETHTQPFLSQESLPSMEAEPEIEILAEETIEIEEVTPQVEEEVEFLEASEPEVLEINVKPLAPIQEEVESVQESVEISVESVEQGKETIKPKVPERVVEVAPPVIERKVAEVKAKKHITRKGRKGRKEEPAKIIKMPEPEVKVVAAPESAPVEKIPAKVISIPVTEAVPESEEELARKSRKKKPKKFEKAPQEEVTAAKKPFLKRKEVLERADLYDDDRIRLPKSKKGVKVVRRSQKTELTIPKAIKRRIKMANETMSVGELSKKMGVKAGEVVKKLFSLGIAAGITQTIDFDTAALVASEFDYEIEKGLLQEAAILAPTKTKEEDRVLRPPVITVMGHVDHGKTTLLDAIRQTNVVSGEAGGITQHIGAYHVKVGDGSVTFLDTPGHEAFTAMRARGAKVTDLVILVVAADDGVMQQTKEAIDHAKAAGVPLIVAINKIDKPNADLERVKRELADYGVVAEEWGGETVFVPVSAKQKQGINELLEYVLLQAELLELKADPTVNARGTIVEARLDRGRGPVATALIQSGTLKVGDTFICGSEFGRVRGMIDDHGSNVDEAGPSMPVEIQGFSGVPNAGDEIIVLSDEKIIKQIAGRRQQESRMAGLFQGSPLTLEDLYKRVQEGEAKALNVVLKADVQGSVEALSDSLIKLSTPQVTVNMIHASTGAISENDVMLSAASSAIIIGFNVRPTAKVRKLAETENVEMRLYDVIYDVISDVKEAMAGRLTPTYAEKVQGQAVVRQIFRISKIGTIAGCVMTEGKLTRNDRVRVIREGVVIADNTVDSLKRFKDDLREVVQGYEFGIHVTNFNDIKEGDIIESYVLEEIKPTLT
jgi:translation initiation factor IF-2